MTGIRQLASDIPSGMKSRSQWVLWRHDEDGKVPVNEAAVPCDATAPRNWLSYSEAVDAAAESDASGIGFYFSENDPFIGIDIDDCLSEGGHFSATASDILARIDSYSEISPSGTGIHIYARGVVPDGKIRSEAIEMYQNGQFLTVTENHIEDTSKRIEDRADQVAEVWQEYISDDTSMTEQSAPSGDWQSTPLGDEEIIEKASGSYDGKFERLWRGDESVWQGESAKFDSHSEADSSLCFILAFWSGDPEQMDRLFRQSGLMRTKWDEVHYSDGSTYGEHCIERALRLNDSRYSR